MEFLAVLKDVKSKSKFFRKSWTKGLQAFHVLAQSLFTTSKTEVDLSERVIIRKIMYEFPHELPNNLRPRLPNILVKTQENMKLLENLRNVWI